MVSFPLHEENTRTEVGEKFIFDSFACLFYLFLFFFDNDAERERERVEGEQVKSGWVYVSPSMIEYLFPFAP